MAGQLAPVLAELADVSTKDAQKQILGRIELVELWYGPALGAPDRWDKIVRKLTLQASKLTKKEAATMAEDIVERLHRQATNRSSEP